MATITDTVDNILREQIADGISDSLPKLDETFKKVFTSSMGVERGSTGRDWQVKMTFSGSIAGNKFWRPAAGGTVAQDGSSGQQGFTVYGATAMQRFLNANEMAAPGWIQKTVTLKKGVGGFPVPLNLLRADKLDAAIGSQLTELVRGTSMGEALSQIQAFFKISVDHAIVRGTLGATSIATGSGTTFTMSSGSGADPSVPGYGATAGPGRVRALYPGFAAYLRGEDAIDTAIGVDGQPVWADTVDYKAKTAKLKIATGSSITGLSTSTVYRVYRYRPDHQTVVTTNSTAPSGLIDFHKTGSTDLFGIDQTKRPQFNSHVTTTYSGALTSRHLNREIGGFNQALGLQLDTILMPEGVLLGFVDNVEGTQQLLRYNVQGEPLSIEAGFSKLGYHYNGKVYAVETSANTHPKLVWILKLGDGNYRKYVPPKLSGAESQAGFSGEVEWVNPVMGSRNIFRPMLSSDALTDFMAADYETWCEFCPKQLPAIQLGSFDEEIA